MQFYHEHGMDVTGRNVWMGLTGMFIAYDPPDRQTLPSGKFDLPVAIADRQSMQITRRSSGLTR
jgi:hypothetical protein